MSYTIVAYAPFLVHNNGGYLEILVKKSVLKEVSKLPKNVQVLYWLFLKDLKREGLSLQGWKMLKMKGVSHHYRVKLNHDYRVILEHVKPDIIIIKVASREGVYK